VATALCPFALRWREGSRQPGGDYDPSETAWTIQAGFEQEHVKVSHKRVCSMSQLTRMVDPNEF
jgi:hypothetical protein